MGWTNSHLHHFVVDGEIYSEPDEDNEMTYEYDFGDGWENALVLEKVLDPDPDAKYPVCLAAERNCPPEDCGGTYGFMEMLDIQKILECLTRNKAPPFDKVALNVS
jgi:hypothetical protein